MSAEARIANVSGAVLLAAGDEGAAHSAALLDSLFSEVLLVGDEAPPDAPGRRVASPAEPLAALVAALEAAGAERVLVVGGDLVRVTPALLLALVAWPEADVVAPAGPGAAGGAPAGAEAFCALYRRTSVLEVARARLAEGSLELGGLLGAVETAVLGAADLAQLDAAGSAGTTPT